MSILLLFSVFIVLLILSASPLLGCFNFRWSLPIMLGLFAAFLLASFALFLSYPFFS